MVWYYHFRLLPNAYKTFRYEIWLSIIYHIHSHNSLITVSNGMCDVRDPVPLVVDMSSPQICYFFFFIFILIIPTQVFVSLVRCHVFMCILLVECATPVLLFIFNRYYLAIYTHEYRPYRTRLSYNCEHSRAPLLVCCSSSKVNAIAVTVAISFVAMGHCRQCIYAGLIRSSVSGIVQFINASM